MPVRQPPRGLITPPQISISDNIFRINLHKCDGSQTGSWTFRPIDWQIIQNRHHMQFLLHNSTSVKRNLVKCSSGLCQPPLQYCGTSWQHKTTAQKRSYGAPSDGIKQTNNKNERQREWSSVLDLTVTHFNIYIKWRLYPEQRCE